MAVKGGNIMTHRIHHKKMILAVAASLSLFIADIALATPAFSRQINADCRTCHFQSMHALNKFGRDFKFNAFSLSEDMKEQLKQSRKKKAAAGSEG